MPTTSISLSSRIQFKEFYFPNGISTDWHDEGRCGMYESNPIYLGIKLNLQGQLSNDIAGRLLLGSNTLIKFLVSDHNYNGSFLLYSYDEETSTGTYIDTISVYNGYLYIHIDDLFEKDAIFTGYLVPSSFVYHEFISVSNNYAELGTNNLLTISSISLINEGTQNNNPILWYCKGDVIDKLEWLVTLSNNQTYTLSSDITPISVNSTDNATYFEFGPNNVSYRLNASSYPLSLKTITNVEIKYLNATYQSLASLSFYLLVFSPNLLYYLEVDNNNPLPTGPSYHVMNIYLPHNILHNIYEIENGLTNNQINASTILYLHGGSWASIKEFTVNSLEAIDDDKFDSNGNVLYSGHFEKISNGYLPELLSRGFIVTSMEYNGINLQMGESGQLYNAGGDCSSMLGDIKNAINFLYNNASPLHIDTSKLCFWGYSAGGHLALLFSYKQNNADIPIKLVVSEAGPTDLFNGYKRLYDNGLMQNINSLNTIIAISGYDVNLLDVGVYNYYYTNDHFYDISPSHYTNSISNLESFLVYGLNDEDVPNSQGGNLRSLINGNNQNTNLCTLISPNVGHSGYSYFVDNDSNLLDEFLYRYFNL